MGTVSHRNYIRWYPEEASEPTSTVVLTSPENRFVDLRILLPPDGGAKLSNEPSARPLALPSTPASHISDSPLLTLDIAAGELALERLDWAIAGTTISEPAVAPTGEAIRRSTFSHWVSSRDADPTGVSDVGDMYPQEDGTTLEKGDMVNPATGRVTAYDELWTDRLAPTSDAIAVLRVDVAKDDGVTAAAAVKGLVVWIGPLCQALVRDGEGIALERWEKTEGSDEEEGAWTRTVRMGDSSRKLPCEDVLTGKVTLEKDGAVACQGDMWQVVELSL